MAFKVVIPQDITDAGKDFLKERGYEIVIGSGSLDLEVLKAEISDADAILARTAPFPAEVLAAAPKLKVIGRHGVGIDNIDVDYCTKNNILVTNAPQSNANSVAEHTIGFLFALAHNMAYMDKETRRGNWEIRNKVKGTDVAEKTLGLIGLGRIGSMVAQKAVFGAGMNVMAFDAMLPADKYPEHITRVDSIEAVFEQADFVSMHVPATPQTKDMVNTKMLSRMKKSAFLINCARGEVVNEDDLYQALKNGTIRGAALDVLKVEPAAATHPLFTLDNILVSPHNAALTHESMDRMGLHAAMGIDAVLNGKKPEWAVNSI